MREEGDVGGGVKVEAQRIIKDADKYAIKGGYKKAHKILKPLLKSKDARTRLEASYEEAYIHFLKDEIDKCEEIVKKTLEEALSIGYPELAAKCYVLRGSVLGERGEALDRIKYYRKAYKLFRETENYYEQCRCLNSIATTYHDIGFYDEALFYYSQALAIALKIENKRAQAYINLNTAGVLIRNNQPEDAEPYIKDAFKLFKGIGEEKEIGRCYATRGELHSKKGEYQKAESDFEKGLEITKKYNKLHVLGYTYKCMAKMYEERKDDEKEIRYLKEAIEVYRKLKNMKEIAELEKRLVGMEYYEKPLR